MSCMMMSVQYGTLEHMIDNVVKFYSGHIQIHHENYWDPYFPPLDRNVNYDPELYPEKWQKYVDFTHNQILELMSDYGPMDILWLDGGWVARSSHESIENYYKNVLFWFQTYLLF